MIQWVKDNLVLTIAIAAAVLLSLLMIIIAIVLTLREQRRSAQESAYERSAYPRSPFGGTTFPGAAARTASAPMVAGQSASPSPGTPMASPGVASGPAPGDSPPSPFQPSTPSPPILPVSPPKTPFQPPTSGSTVIIRRGPKLKVLGMLMDKKESWRRFKVDKPTMTIGRAPGNNFVVEHATVSRQHAVIKIEDADLRLYDLGSANGTFVNDKRVREPVALQDGDTVRLGEAEFIFKRVVL